MLPVQPMFSHRKGATLVGDDKQTFKVVMIYEDRPTGKRAMVAFQCLSEHLEDEFTVENNLWNFELLRTPKMREVAARETARADMVIISAHGEKELPDSIKAWIQKWVARKKAREGALVALLDRQPHVRCDSNSPALMYLRKIADRAQIDFFSHGAELPGRRFEPSLVDSAEATEPNGTEWSVRPPKTGPTWL